MNVLSINTKYYKSLLILFIESQGLDVKIMTMLIKPNVFYEINDLA